MKKISCTVLWEKIPKIIFQYPHETDSPRGGEDRVSRPSARRGPVYHLFLGPYRSTA